MRKTTICAALCAALAVAAAVCGCVSKVSGGNQAGIPWTKDSFTGSYPRTLDQVYKAAKDVLAQQGTLVSDGTLYGQEAPARIVQAKVNQRDVYVKIMTVDPKTTSMTLQVRAPGGTTDLSLTQYLKEQIAVKLAAM